MRLEIALGAAAGNGSEALEEFIEGIVFRDIGQALAPTHCLRDVDRNDRRTLLFVEIGEVRQARAALRRGRHREGRDQREQQDAEHGT